LLVQLEEHTLAGLPNQSGGGSDMPSRDAGTFFIDAIMDDAYDRFDIDLFVKILIKDNNKLFFNLIDNIYYNYYSPMKVVN
jgi:hypothetical protein